MLSESRKQVPTLPGGGDEAEEGCIQEWKSELSLEEGWVGFCWFEKVGSNEGAKNEVRALTIYENRV